MNLWELCPEGQYVYELKYQYNTEWNNLIPTFKQRIMKSNGGLKGKVVDIFHEIVDVD
jgi:hypothetical protein